MKKVLCNIIILCIASKSFAFDLRKPLIQSAAAENSEYYAFLSINSDYMSYSNYQILVMENDSINDKISNLYLKAKQNYYEKQYYKSIHIFQEIIGLRNKYQLNTHSKKLVLNSIMKLYELSPSISDQKKYFRLLRSTYPYIKFDDLVIIESLLQKLDESPLLFNNWEIPEQFNKFNYLVINGKKHDIYPGKKLKLPKGSFIVSLISDAFYPIHKFTTKAELENWIPNSEWVNTGACDNPNLKVNKLFKAASIFYKHNCVIENDSKTKVTKHIKTKAYKKSISDLKPKHHYTTIKYKEKKDYKWLKNKWFWLGLGAIATTIAIANNQDKNKDKSTPKRGF